MAHESDMHRHLLDVRGPESFRAAHAPGAANVPLEELPARLHELPPADEAVAVTDADELRAEAAATFLRARGSPVEVVAFDAAAQTESGPARARLWRPNAFLVEALAEIGAPPPAAAPRRALDLACGSGRDAVFLALAGFDVEALDVLPDALERARDLAARTGVRLETTLRDVEREPTLPAARYDLVCVFHFLWRDLFAAIRDSIRPGGFVVYETFHARNRDTGKRPFSPAHILEPGELAGAFAGFELLIFRDGIERGGRFVSSLLARKPG
jgi:SAM-dependent methyltransferase